MKSWPGHALEGLEGGDIEELSPDVAGEPLIGGHVRAPRSTGDRMGDGYREVLVARLAKIASRDREMPSRISDFPNRLSALALGSGVEASSARRRSARMGGWQGRETRQGHETSSSGANRRGRPGTRREVRDRQPADPEVGQRLPECGREPLNSGECSRLKVDLSQLVPVPRDRPDPRFVVGEVHPLVGRVEVAVRRREAE